MPSAEQIRGIVIWNLPSKKAASSEPDSTRHAPLLVIVGHVGLGADAFTQYANVEELHKQQSMFHGAWSCGFI